MLKTQNLAHQAAAPKARAEVNTPRTSVASVGMDHTEVNFLFWISPTEPYLY